MSKLPDPERSPVIRYNGGLVDVSLPEADPHAVVYGTPPSFSVQVDPRMFCLYGGLAYEAPRCEELAEVDKSKLVTRKHHAVADILLAVLDQLTQDRNWTIGSKRALIEHANVPKTTGHSAFKKNPHLEAAYRKYCLARSGGRVSKIR